MNDKSDDLISDEIILLVKLKYGEPCKSKDYINSLPVSVINEAFRNINSNIDENFYKSTETRFRAAVLSIMLRQPANRKRAQKYILKALYKYHAEHE